MPYKLNRPPRDLAKVKCVKKKKDKNGDVHYDLVVMFDHVSVLKLFQKQYGATYIFLDFRKLPNGIFHNQTLWI